MATLATLARLYGIQPSYRDYRGQVRHASEAALRATLAVFGAPPVANDNEIRAAITQRRAELARPTPPAAAYWLGQGNTIRVRLHAPGTDFRLHLDLRTEEGNHHRWSVSPETLAAGAIRERAESQVTVDVALPAGLPAGYHTLDSEIAGRHWQTLVIAAPPKAYQPGLPGRWWGAFLPLYALRTGRAWHAGDYSDLRRLVDWTAQHGGQMAGTLPLLAGFLDGAPYDHSPYAPASRLAWNELYIDIEASPELVYAPATRALLLDATFAKAIEDLGERRMVDYPALYRLKRRALEPLAEALFAPGNESRLAGFHRFLEASPHLGEYARFRAIGERQGTAWQAWPERLRLGDVDAGDYDQAAAHYHEYVQWLATEQLALIAPEASPAGLYMDLPLGVHASGFDTWRFRESFAPGASAGAPPDGLFVGGQDWGFPPLHPQRLRRDSYRYFIGVVRHHMRHARVLRIDHVMGLYRQYWIPQGFAATEGVYVRYPADELTAILCLESHRHRCVVVGENLGTVPAAVEHLLERHGFRPMHVAEFAATGDARGPFAEPAPASLAAIGTHDTPTFAGWWYGLDIHDKLALGLVDEDQAREEHAGREAVRTSIEAYVTQREADRSPDDPPLTRWLSGTLRHLAESDAWAVLVNLEDLLLELQPQNVPGTHRERPNWLRKASATLEAMMSDPAVGRILGEVARLRRR